MLEYIRTHQRVAQIMLALVALALLLSGVGSWDWVNRDANSVASVAGQSIGQQEWENTQREQTDRFRRMMGARFDPKMLESPEMKQRMLESMVERRVLDIEAKQRLLTIGEQALQEEIVNTPDFHGADGKFDKEAYITRLAMAGISPQIHQAQLRESKMLGQFNTGLAGSAFAPRTVANRLSDINDEEREAQEILFKASDYTDKVKITDEMVKDYYNKNGKKFELPEQVKIDYVLLNNDVAAAQLTIADAEAKAVYDKNVKRYTEEEQRRASHILVKLAKDASSADKVAAKAKAEKLLAQVRANKADFAKLAKENSDDPGSAAQGGDLDFFVFGSMVKPFAEATFKLKKDEISDLVLSDFGYHIILLTDVKPSKQKTFDEVKSEILAEMRRDLVAKKFSELTEVFNNAVDENSEGLKAIAENPKLKLKIQSVTDVTRQGNMTLGPQSPVNNPKFLKALFASQEVLKGKRNSDVVPVEQNTLIAAHVTEYKPAKVRPLEEVQPAIKDFLLKKEASELAKKDGLAKVAALKAKDDVTGFGEGKVVSRSKQPAMSAIAAQEVLKADTSKLPAFVGVELPGMGYAVYRIGKVSQSATPDAARRKTEQEQIAGIYSQQDFYAAMEWMKQKNKVSINKKAANIVPAASEASASASAK